MRPLVVLILLPALLGAGYEWGGPAARGVGALKAQRYKDALEALRDGKEDLPRSAALRFDEGLALEGEGRPEQAAAAYRAALALSGERAKAAAAFNLGTRAMRGRRYPEAVGWYRESLKLRSGDLRTKRALEEAIRMAREEQPKSGAASGSGDSPQQGKGPENPPPNPGQGGASHQPPAGSRAGSGEFSREEAEHWLDALETERRAGREQERRGEAGTNGARDW